MISDRIESLITHFCNGNKSLFAQRIGVRPSVIGNITGERKGNPSFEVIQKILNAFASVNPDWFILDRGPMLRSKQDSNNVQSISGDNNIQTGNNSKVNARLSQNDSIEMLHSQINEKDKLLIEKDLRIKEKDIQIKEKDAQISKLLSILSK